MVHREPRVPDAERVTRPLGRFIDPPRARVRIRDSELMPDGVAAQPGMGDVEEEFAAVTQGFDEMHLRIPERPIRFGEEPAPMGVEPVDFDLDMSLDVGSDL